MSTSNNLIWWLVAAAVIGYLVFDESSSKSSKPKSDWRCTEQPEMCIFSRKLSNGNMVFATVSRQQSGFYKVSINGIITADKKALPESVSADYSATTMQEGINFVNTTFSQ